VLILKEGSSRRKGKEALLGNISAARVVADVVKATLGPRGMDKMLVDTIGDVTITNDGHEILKEIDVLRTSHLKVPVVLLRVYLQLSKEVEEKIRDLADFVFYKPIDVNAVADAVHKLLDGQ
jgi:chaperonin GroEL (HSP60 family)